MAKEPKVKKIVVKDGEAEALPVKKDKQDFNPITYIVAFQIEGHSTWRKSMFSKRDGLKVYLAMPAQKNHPKVTTERWFEFDGLTGNITEVK